MDRNGAPITETAEIVRADAAPQASSTEDVLTALGVDPTCGLEPDEAGRRLRAVGPNTLPQPRPEPLHARIVRQLREPMALLLLVAAAVSGVALGEVVDAVAIAALVALNAVIALVEEGRAQSALAALRALEVPKARVRRANRTLVVATPEIVPGEVVLVGAGDRVPADLRLVEAHGLEVDESVLTGESLPVAKDSGCLPAPDAGLAERADMAYSGTFVTRGLGTGVAVATGIDTALGRIAQEVSISPKPTPLQADLAEVTRRLGGVSVAIAVAVLLLTLVRVGFAAGQLQQAFLAAVALAVAAVPEGLATVTAVALALGVHRMAQQGAVIRRLPAVETLGSATVIAVDKTGTLTENRMALEAVAPAGGRFVAFSALDVSVREATERIVALCSDAELDPSVGDPTEIALLQPLGAARVRELRASWPRLEVALRLRAQAHGLSPPQPLLVGSV